MSVQLDGVRQLSVCRSRKIGDVPRPRYGCTPRTLTLDVSEDTRAALRPAGAQHPRVWLHLTDRGPPPGSEVHGEMASEGVTAALQCSESSQG